MFKIELTVNYNGEQEVIIDNSFIAEIIIPACRVLKIFTAHDIDENPFHSIYATTTVDGSTVENKR